MLELTLKDDGDGFETAMRMLIHTARSAVWRWRELVRPCVIEQQKRADRGRVLCVHGKNRTHRKPIADPVRLRRGEHRFNASHEWHAELPKMDYAGTGCRFVGFISFICAMAL